MPSLEGLSKWLHPQVSSKWYELGVAVGMSEEQLNNLVSEDSDENLQTVLEYWLRNHYSKPTWQDVIKILDELKLPSMPSSLNLHKNSKCCMYVQYKTDQFIEH